MNNIIKNLTLLPATDEKFLSALKNATKEELLLAINDMKILGGSHKSRISACEKELKKRSDIYNFIKKDKYLEISNFTDKLGEQFYDFFMEETNYTTEIGKSILNVFFSCKTKSEMIIADRMLVATCGYGFSSILDKIKKRDLENYAW